MDMSLRKLQELVMDRDVWHYAAHGVSESQIQLSKWSATVYVRVCVCVCVCVLERERNYAKYYSDINHHLSFNKNKLFKISKSSFYIFILHIILVSVIADLHLHPVLDGSPY